MDCGKAIRNSISSIGCVFNCSTVTAPPRSLFREGRRAGPMTAELETFGTEKQNKRRKGHSHSQSQSYCRILWEWWVRRGVEWSGGRAGGLPSLNSYALISDGKRRNDKKQGQFLALHALQMKQPAALHTPRRRARAHKKSQLRCLFAEHNTGQGDRSRKK